MNIKILKNESFTNDSSFPKTATPKSTGYDIVAVSEPEIVGVFVKGSTVFYDRIDYIQYKTNLRISIESDGPIHNIDYDALVMPRSSISKYNLVLANSIGLIDVDYRGEILVRFKYIWQPENLLYVPTPDGNLTEISARIVAKPDLSKIYKKGDKICQIKFSKVEHAQFYLVDVLDETVRNEGGFGSTSTPIVPDSTMKTMIENYQAKPVFTPERKYSDVMNELKINKNGAGV